MEALIWFGLVSLGLLTAWALVSIAIALWVWSTSERVDTESTEEISNV